jgi:hypothetical protein
VTSSRPLHFAGCEDELPAGGYEDLLQDLSFEAYRRSAAYLIVGARIGGRKVRPIDPQDLEAALAKD